MTEEEQDLAEESFDEFDDVEFSELSQLEDEIRELHESEENADTEQWQDLLERVQKAKPKPERGLIPIKSKSDMRRLERRFDRAIEEGNEEAQDRMADSMIYKEDRETWRQMKSVCQFMINRPAKKRVDLDGSIFEANESE